MRRPHPSPRPVATLLLAAAVLLVAAGCAAAKAPASAQKAKTTKNVAAAARGRTAATAHPRIRHVFVIVLENEDAATTFGAHTQVPYLARTLVRRGAYLPRYYGIGHASLDNYVAMVSGQAPNPATQIDCPVFTDVTPATPQPDGQVAGSGCVYPRSVQTIAGQLDGAGDTWKAYAEDMGDDPARDGGRTCAHPALGSADGARVAAPGDQYATRHNPFVYFHSIIDGPTCARRDVSLAALPRDLRTPSRTPNLSFIVPDLCHDGHDATCAGGGPAGPAGVEAFLRRWVPRITRSRAYRRDGLLAIVFDEAADDASACCSEPTGPNTDHPGGGPGGGRTGAVLLSRFIRPGTRSRHAYNHYSLLRSIEDLFGLKHLGYAATPGLRPFGSDVYTRAHHHHHRRRG